MITIDELRDKIGTNNNLKFHDYEMRHGAGSHLAFVTCIDVQSNGKGTGKKYYFGKVSGFEPTENEIKTIMSCGGKWSGYDNSGMILL